MLPVLTYTQPAAAADALRWRHTLLDEARTHAAELGLAGAAFPWRTIHGQECSGYWPAGTAAFHINADIADAVVTLPATPPRTPSSSGRSACRSAGRDRPPVALARPARRRTASSASTGVTGPDEYSAVKDNNVYTNLMAQRQPRLPPPTWRPSCQRRGARSSDVTHRGGRRPGATPPTTCTSPTTSASASTRSTTASPTTPAGTSRSPPEDHYPLLLHYPYFQLYRKQVVKQADLVLAMQLRPRRVHRPSRSSATSTTTRRSPSGTRPCRPARRRSWPPRSATSTSPTTTWPRPRFMDLQDRRAQHQGRPAHRVAGRRLDWRWSAGSAACARAPGRSFSPRLPAGLAGLTFRMRYRGRRLRVTITSRHAKYELLDGEPLPVVHHGKEFRAGQPRPWNGDPGGDRRPPARAAARPRPLQPRQHLT